MWVYLKLCDANFLCLDPITAVCIPNHLGPMSFPMCMLGTACGVVWDDGLGDHGSQDSTGSELSEQIQRPHQDLVNTATFGK